MLDVQRGEVICSRSVGAYLTLGRRTGVQEVCARVDEQEVDFEVLQARTPGRRIESRQLGRGADDRLVPLNKPQDCPENECERLSRIPFSVCELGK